MRILHLPLFWTVALDIVAWYALHMGIAYGMTQVPPERFDLHAGLYRQRVWEEGGKIYQSLFQVRRWKDLLPEGAALFAKGFRKRHLQERSDLYLQRFAQETCRAECTHWITLAVAPLFFLWNPPTAGMAMIFYALVANIPCVIAQRYNRIRLTRLFTRFRK